MSEADPNTPTRIGILDSGVGGLSVLTEIRKLLPSSPVHYVGDSAWCPYGNKDPEVIRSRVMDITDYLIGRGAGIIVIACNSATIHGVGDLRATYPIPIVGMEPGVKPAAEQSRAATVGVLATEASIAGEKFHQLVSNHAKGVKVITRPCPRFVELVEAGTLSGEEVDSAVEEALQPILEAGADVVVLGCTHYPFLRASIEKHLPEGVSLIDTGPAVARRVQSQLLITGQQESDGPILVETTGELDLLKKLLPSLLPGIPCETAHCEINSSK